MSFLLMVFLTLVCVFVESYQPPAWGGSPWQSVLFAVVSVSLVGLHAFWVSRRVSWPLRRDPSRRDELLAHYDRGRFLHQFVQFGMFGLALIVLGWGWAVRELWKYHGGPLPGLELLTLAPFLIGQALTWAFFYDADRAAHRAAYRLVGADSFGQSWLEGRQPAPPAFGGRWAYVVFQMRQKFALVFIPVLLLVVRQEIARLIPGAWTRWPLTMNVLAILSLTAVFIVMPLLIRLALGLKPLPPGVLRDRLLAATRRLGFRCTDILLWNTRSGMANAMVIGLVPWLRYVVFTDRLIEEFSEDEVEAVFGHEVGHIRHQHMLYYLFFLITSMLLLGVTTDHYLLPLLAWGGGELTELFPQLPPLGTWFGPNGDLSPFPVVLVLLVYVFSVFGYLSRRCERQADVFGCKAVSCRDRACEGHTEETALADRGTSLCPTGIRTFIRALEKVALVNGISRDRPGFLQSWQHASIAQRVEFLRQLLTEPEIEPVFQARLWRVKAGLLTGLSLALLTLVYLHEWQW